MSMGLKRIYIPENSAAFVFGLVFVCFLCHHVAVHNCLFCLFLRDSTIQMYTIPFLSTKTRQISNTKNRK